MPVSAKSQAGGGGGTKQFPSLLSLFASHEGRKEGTKILPQVFHSDAKSGGRGIAYVRVRPPSSFLSLGNGGAATTALSFWQDVTGLENLQSGSVVIPRR